MRRFVTAHVFSCITDVLQLLVSTCSTESVNRCFSCLSGPTLTLPEWSGMFNNSNSVLRLHLPAFCALSFHKTFLNPAAFFGGKDHLALIKRLGEDSVLRKCFWYRCVKLNVTSRCHPSIWRTEVGPIRLLLGVFCGHYSGAEEMMRFYVKCSPRLHSSAVSSFAVWTLVAGDFVWVPADGVEMWTDLEL